MAENDFQFFFFMKLGEENNSISYNNFPSAKHLNNFLFFLMYIFIYLRNDRLFLKHINI